jgi:hypothetical protein
VDVPAEISTLLEVYRREVRALEPLGSYVAGSVALGAWNAMTSDVDVVTLLPGAIDRGKLRALHRKLALAHPGARRLECIYLAPSWTGVRVAGGRLRGRGRLTAVARAEIHAGGLVLAGRLGEVRAPVRGELDAEMRWNLDHYWRAKRWRWDLSLFTEFCEFAVSTLARIRWTQQHGTITTKPAALEWLPDAAAALRLGRLARARAVLRLIGDTTRA